MMHKAMDISQLNAPMPGLAISLEIRQRILKKENAEKRVLQWMKGHKAFVSLMDQLAFEIVKGSWGPNEQFNAAFVRRKNLEIFPE